MTTLQLKSRTPIKGRASVSGNIPSIQVPVVSSPREVPKYPFATPPPSPHQPTKQIIKASKRYLISDNLMDRFSNSILELRNFCVSLSEINFCPVIQNVELVEQVDILNYIFQPFYNESKRYIAALHQSEIDRTYVGSDGLKQSSFPFVQQWNQYVQLVNKVRDNGIPSMAQYLQIKFQIIEGVITDISKHQKRDSVHITEVVHAADTLKELLYQIDTGVNYLILKTDLRQMPTDVLESKIRDMRTFMRLYETEHHSEFVKSGYSTSELIHLRATVQSSVLDIIGGLRAAFSFQSDLDKIYSQIAEIHKMLKRIAEQINIPQSVTHIVEKKVITDPRLRKKRPKDPLKNIKDFANQKERVVAEDDIVLCGKLELYIEKVATELDIPPMSRQINIWERLQSLQEKVVARIKYTKETEKEFQLFKEKTKNQSSEITALMKSSNRKAAQTDEMERTLTKKIADLETRNAEMLKQRNEALTITKRREEQLFKIRLQYNESGAWKALEDAAHILSRFLGMEIPDSKDLPKSVSELAGTLNKRGCVKCHQNEELFEDIKKRVGKIVQIKPRDTFVSIISNLIIDHQKMKYQCDSVNLGYSKVADDIQAMKDCILGIETKCKTILNVKTESDPERTITDMSNETTNLFKLVLDKHQKEVDVLINQHLEKRQDELSEIMNQALSIFPNENITKKDNIADMIVDILKSANENINDLKLENKKKDAIIEKISEWMKVKTGSEENDIDSLMNMIDTTKNPLENVLYEQKQEKDHFHQEFYLIVTKIKGICKVTEQTDYMDLNTLIKFTSSILDNLQDKLEDETNQREKDNHNNNEIISSLAGIIAQIQIMLRHSETIDYSKETIESLLNKLGSCVDQLSSEKNFIKIETINKLTERMRKEDILNSIDPQEYLPMVAQKMEAYFNTINVIKKLLVPILNIFRDFDFKLQSYDPSSQAFNSLKTNLMSMHDILKSELKGEIIPECATFLSKDVSLLSALFGFNTLAFSELSGT